MEFPLTLATNTDRWRVGVTGTSDDAVMWSEWGREGGKIQRSERRYNGGKQGRDALQQAHFEAESCARKKLRLGYSPLGAAAAPPEPCGTKNEHASETAPLPMLATDWLKVKRPERLLPEFLLQPKLDGIRCVANTRTGALFSRTGKPLLGLDHIGQALVLATSVAQPPAQWVDGEIYKHGASFQGIVGAARRTVNLDRDQAEQLELHMFDYIGSAPCSMRMQLLGQWLAAATGFVTPGKLHSLRVVPTETVCCGSVAEVQDTIDAAVERFVHEGYEGAIGRVSSAPYVERKRSLDLVKAKRFLQEEFTVIRLEERPKQPGIVATVRCTTANGQEFGATPECTHQEKQAMWDRRSEYLDGKWVASVRFQELSDGGVPRFPVCAGLRHVDDC